MYIKNNKVSLFNQKKTNKESFFMSFQFMEILKLLGG